MNLIMISENEAVNTKLIARIRRRTRQGLCVAGKKTEREVGWEVHFACMDRVSSTVSGTVTLPLVVFYGDSTQEGQAIGRLVQGSLLEYLEEPSE